MKKGVLYIALAALLFSTMEVALKAVAGQFHPIQLTATRFVVGGLVLLPFAVHALRQKGKQLQPGTLGYFALLGLMNVVVSMTLYQLAVMHAEASVVAVLFSANPIFVMLFAALILHEVIEKHQVLALVLELAGILVIVNPAHMQTGAAGIAFTGLATVTFALYSVMGKKKCRDYGSLAVTCGSFLCGGAEMLLLIALSHVPALARALQGAGLGLFARIPLFSGYTPQDIAVVLYICVGVTGAGFACYFLAMEATSTSLASLVFFFKPALAPLFALGLLHEAISLNMFVGIIIMLAGSLVSLLPPLLRQSQQREAELAQASACAAQNRAAIMEELGRVAANSSRARQAQSLATANAQQLLAQKQALQAWGQELEQRADRIEAENAELRRRMEQLQLAVQQLAARVKEQDK